MSYEKTPTQSVADTGITSNILIVDPVFSNPRFKFLQKYFPSTKFEVWCRSPIDEINPFAEPFDKSRWTFTHFCKTLEWVGGKPSRHPGLTWLTTGDLSKFPLSDDMLDIFVSKDVLMGYVSHLSTLPANDFSAVYIRSLPYFLKQNTRQFDIIKDLEDTVLDIRHGAITPGDVMKASYATVIESIKDSNLPSKYSPAIATEWFRSAIAILESTA